LNDMQSEKISQAIQSGANLCAPETIICTERIYAPDVKDHNGVTEYCDSGECITLNKIIYNSSVAFSRCSDCTLKDSEPGGRYNYVESYCRSVGIDQVTGAEFRAYADDLNSA